MFSNIASELDMIQSELNISCSLPTNPITDAEIEAGTKPLADDNVMVILVMLSGKRKIIIISQAL